MAFCAFLLMLANSILLGIGTYLCTSPLSFLFLGGCIINSIFVISLAVHLITNE